MAYYLSVDGKFSAVFHDIVMVSDDSEKFYFLFTFEFEQSLLAAKVPLVA